MLITKNVGSAPGRDYPTWQAAIDSLPKDLVADGNAYEIVGWADSEFTSTTGRVITIMGFTCDATHNIRLRCGSGQSWRNAAGVQTNAVRYNAANGVALSATGSSTSVIFCDSDYLEIDGLQVQGNAFSLMAMDLRASHIKIDNVIADGRPENNNQYVVAIPGTNAQVHNSFVFNRQPDTRGLGVGAGSEIDNCTVALAAECTANIGIANISGADASVACTIKNTAVLGYDVPVYNYFNGSNNATSAPDFSANTGSFTSSLTGLAVANQVISTALASCDLRIKPGSALIDAGTTTPYAISANGVSRPSGGAFDIGAWEFVVPATTLTLTGSATAYKGFADTLTVGTNGSLTGNIVVTPSDNGAGGTFNPPTVTLTPLAPSASTDYTPATTGNASITITNNGSLSNPAAKALTVGNKAPSGIVTSQPAPDGQNLVVTFSTEADPVSGMATLSPDLAATPDASTTSGVVALGTNTGTATFTNIPPGKYTLVITLTNAGGTGNVTGAQSVTVISIMGSPQADTGAPDTSAPIMSGTLAISSITGSGFTLGWTAGVDDIGVASYEMSLNGGSFVSAGSGTSKVVTGLAALTAYSVALRAVDFGGNVSNTITGNATTLAAAPVVTPNTVSIPLNDPGTNLPFANLANLRWAWFDQATPNLFAAPTDKGTAESTDSNGQLTIALPNSTLQKGAIGWLVITNSTGNPALTHNAFSGPIAVG